MLIANINEMLPQSNTTHKDKFKKNTKSKAGF